MNKDNDLSKGINFLYYLRNKYTDELNSEYFLLRSCPYEDIRQKYDQRCDTLRSQISIVNSKIDIYQSACIDLEMINMLNPETLSIEDKYNKFINYKKISDMESYNIELYTSYTLLYTLRIGIEHIIKTYVSPDQLDLILSETTKSESIKTETIKSESDNI